MELWVAFGFGAAVGALIGHLLGRLKPRPAATPIRAVATPPPPPPKPRLSPTEVKHVVLDEGSANVLNALNNRLAAIGGLADLLHGRPLDPARARAPVRLPGAVRRAAETPRPCPGPARRPAAPPEPSGAPRVLDG